MISTIAGPVLPGWQQLQSGIFYSSVLVSVKNHFFFDLIKLVHSTLEDNNEGELFFPHTHGMIPQSDSARNTSYLAQDGMSVLIVILGITTRFKAWIELRWPVAKHLKYFDSFVSMVLYYKHFTPSIQFREETETLITERLKPFLQFLNLLPTILMAVCLLQSKSSAFNLKMIFRLKSLPSTNRFE